MKAYKGGLADDVRRAVATDPLVIQDKLVMSLRFGDGLSVAELPAHLRPDKRLMRDQARIFRQLEVSGLPTEKPFKFMHGLSRKGTK